MLAIRQIIEDPQDVIPIPPEFRHRRTEVIFMALEPEQGTANPSACDAIDVFRGKGKGGAVSRLLGDRQADREQEI